MTIPNDSISQTLAAQCDPDFLFESRVQALPGFSGDSSPVFVKREDESGFSLSAGKRRKYASLWFRVAGHQGPLGLIGGANGNHLPAFLQILGEKGRKATLFIRQPRSPAKGANRLLLDLLATEQEIVWLDAEEWPRAETTAQEMLGPQALVIPEGGACSQAMPGAATLAWDILRNEKEYNLVFDHLFLDAGTGLSAAATALELHRLGSQTRIWVVSMAEKPVDLYQRFEEYRGWWESIIGVSAAWPDKMEILAPSTARAFGSVNSTIRTFIREVAAGYGLVLDPVYNAKLFLTARNWLEKENLKGNVLVVHSGGGLGVFSSDLFSGG